VNLGTVRFQQNQSGKRGWVIQCAPHVALHLKRVFARIDKHSHDAFFISDTAETCNNLRWFMQRYPLEIPSREDRTRLAKQAEEHREQTALVDRLLSRRMPPPEFELAIPPREYQRVAAAVMLSQGGLLLADDVGLGKTVSAITAFADPRMLPALVVTLTHLPLQWQAEINRFAPRLKIHIVKSGKPYDITDRKALSKSRKCHAIQMAIPEHFPDVVIMNYAKLHGWAEHIAPLVRSVVYDECQELRRSGQGNDLSLKYAAALHVSMSVRFRMGLSATPIYGYGGEIYNVVNCIRPDVLGTREEFEREWCGRSDKPDQMSILDPAAFGAYLKESGIMLRRTRADVGRELPELTKVPHRIDANLHELDKVSASCAELAKTILKQNEHHRGEKMQASEMFANLLRQATGIAKAPYVAEFVRLLVENGEPVVLYGWHREVYSIWLDKLWELRPLMYTGSESVVAKNHAKNEFMSGNSKVLIMSLRSGAGVDGLQGICRTVVFGELDWSPGVHEQCIGRIHRDGQGDKVLAYYLMADHGSDPEVARALGLKKEQIEGLRQEKPEELVKKLQTDGGHIRRLAEQYLAKTNSSTTEDTKEHKGKAAKA
jgi:SNF2 family DNA or RNA helicase